MKISIDSFGGNKDNYYNFEKKFNSAFRDLATSHLYVNPFFENSELGKLSKLLYELREKFAIVEFED
jgi:hypothetical protein